MSEIESLPEKKELRPLGLTTSVVVWIATALLHKENPSRSAFTIREIEEKVNGLNLLSVQQATITQHITAHCVANSYASPDTNRILFRVGRGLYRLYRRGDSFHSTRQNGKITPIVEVMPKEYLNLLEWYEKEYSNKTSSTFQEITKSFVNTPFAKIEPDFRVKIPQEIITKLNVSVGDHIAFIENSDTIQIKKARLQIMV